MIHIQSLILMIHIQSTTKACQFSLMNTSDSSILTAFTSGLLRASLLYLTLNHMFDE